MFHKIKQLGLSTPEPKQVFRNTVFVAAAMGVISALIFGADTLIVGLMHVLV